MKNTIINFSEFKPLEYINEKGEPVEHPYIEVHNFYGEQDVVLNLAKFEAATKYWDYSI